MRIPAPLFAALRSYHDAGAGGGIDEHVPGFIEGPASVASQLLQLPETLRHQTHACLLPEVERWSGLRAVPTCVYGVRRYLQGATLKMHCDRTGTHALGVTMNIAQRVVEPWPLHVEELPGRTRRIVLEPGEMLLYDSERLPHGRPVPLRGDFYAGVFAHFRIDRATP